MRGNWGETQLNALGISAIYCTFSVSWDDESWKLLTERLLLLLLLMDFPIFHHGNCQTSHKPPPTFLCRRQWRWRPPKGEENMRKSSLGWLGKLCVSYCKRRRVDDVFVCHRFREKRWGNLGGKCGGMRNTLPPPTTWGGGCPSHEAAAGVCYWSQQQNKCITGPAAKEGDKWGILSNDYSNPFKFNDPSPLQLGSWNFSQLVLFIFRERRGVWVCLVEHVIR